MSEWISVDERLPDTERMVDIFAIEPKERLPCCEYVNCWWWDTINIRWIEPMYISHWIEITEPPSDGTEEESDDD